MTTKKDTTKVKEIPKGVSEGDKKYEKYLTEMKELPAYEAKNESGSESKEVKERTSELPIEPVKNSKVTGKANLIASKMSEELVSKDESGWSESRKGTFEEKIYSAKDIIIGVINIFSIIFLIIILSKFPAKAQELRDLRNANIKAEEDISFSQVDLSVYKEKVDKLSELFLDETGIVEFLNALEKLKVNNPSITKFNVESQEAVKDRTDNYGLPVSIEMKGSWEDFERNLSNIQNLQYLFRPIKIEIEPSKDEPGVLRFKYGLFLYVNDKIGENR